MKQSTVRKLEERLEEAIADVVARLGHQELPLNPSRQTMHLMAKAAVSVFEAVVENQRPP